MDALTPEQLVNLQDIATKVRSNYTALDITEILNRIHFVTGRDFKRCIIGLKMILARGMFPNGFVLCANKLPKLETMINQNFPIIEALGLEFVDAATSMKNEKLTHVIQHDEADVLDGTDNPDEDEFEVIIDTKVIESDIHKPLGLMLNLDANF